ncbi:hypothetical protein D3C76_1295280 [compost metagenome]
MPEKDRLSERNHPGNRQDRRRQAGRVGLQLRSRRRQAQGPHRAQPQVRRRTRGAVVHLQVRTARQCTHQQTAEHQRQTPVEQRRDHGDQRDPGHGGATVFRQLRQAVDQLYRRWRTGHHITADHHERHLHGERDQAPEAVTKGHGRVGRLGAHEQGGHGDDDYRQGGKYPGVGEPAFGKT